MQNRRMKIMHVDAVFRDINTVFDRRSVDDSRLYSCTRSPRAEHLVMVLASRVFKILVIGSASEFRCPDNWRVVQHAPNVEISDQLGERFELFFEPGVDGDRTGDFVRHALASFSKRVTSPLGVRGRSEGRSSHRRGGEHDVRRCCQKESHCYSGSSDVPRGYRACRAP